MLGLEVRLQPVNVAHWVRGAESAELVEFPAMVPGTTQKIVLTALGGSTSTAPDGLTAEVITVNKFDELTALGRDKVAGKIVLFNEIFDKQKAAAGFAFAAYGEAVRYRGAGPKAAADLGAVACLVRSVGMLTIDCRTPDSARRGHPRRRSHGGRCRAHYAPDSEGRVRMHLTLLSQKTAGRNRLQRYCGFERRAAS